MSWTIKYLALSVVYVLICHEVVSDEIVNKASSCDFYTVAFGAVDCLQHFKGLSENSIQEEHCSSIRNYVTCLEKIFSNCSEREMNVLKIDVPWQQLKSLKICQPELDTSAK